MGLADLKKKTSDNTAATSELEHHFIKQQKNSDLLVIIPAYNEEESLVATMKELTTTCPEFDYVIVNDGSTDSTALICRSNCYNFLDLPINLGLTGAFQTGMRYAKGHGYKYALQFDSDGQHVPKYIAPMLKKMEQDGDDIVIGSRFVNAKKNRSARMAGSNLISFLCKVTTGKFIADPTSGMRLFDAKMIDEFASRYDFGPEPDTVAYLVGQGAKVGEVAVEMRERFAGESYLTFTKSISYMARSCTAILCARLFR